MTQHYIHSCCIINVFSKLTIKNCYVQVRMCIFCIQQPATTGNCIEKCSCMSLGIHCMILWAFCFPSFRLICGEIRLKEKSSTTLKNLLDQIFSAFRIVISGTSSSKTFTFVHYEHLFCKLNSRIPILKVNILFNLLVGLTTSSQTARNVAN